MPITRNGVWEEVYLTYSYNPIVRGRAQIEAINATLTLEPKPTDVNRLIAEMEDLHGHLEHGMHILTKPFSMDALAARISQLLRP